MFRFGFSQALFLYVLVPLLGLFLWQSARHKRKAMAHLAHAPLLKKLVQTVHRRSVIAKRLLMLVVVLLVVSALARPQFGTRVETVRREGRDVIVAIDASASMRAEDAVPNRLERAKLSVRSLIAGLRGDRIGLVVFAGEAYVQSPLTSDYGAAMMFLDAIQTDLVPVPGTNIPAAIDRAIQMFESGEPDNRMLVMVTDGEDHSEMLDAAVQRAKDAGVTIFTVGIGSPEGVPIPEFDDSGQRRGFKRDMDGQVVLSRLDQESLERIARETGGDYVHLTSGVAPMETLASEIAGSDGRELETQEITQFEEQFQIFLGLALLLITTEFLLPERRRTATVWRGRFQ